ncbi:MAG: S-layer homology domain-containing protein, partial [Clostridia bacterium]|nr:S-layer homology domain-containing protein [Clostridia bacterium]
AKNTIPADSIPDVAGPSSEQEKAIYKFYRAGIVNGTDAYGTFKPDDNVIRAEVAAILVRIMAPENRVAAPALLGK